jgi:hypothetical protein
MLNFLKKFNTKKILDNSLSRKISAIKNSVYAAVFSTLLISTDVNANNDVLEVNSNDVYTTKEYTIKDGDRLSSIADFYGVDLDILLDYEDNYKYKKRKHLVYP